MTCVLNSYPYMPHACNIDVIIINTAKAKNYNNSSSAHVFSALSMNLRPTILSNFYTLPQNGYCQIVHILELILQSRVFVYLNYVKKSRIYLPDTLFFCIEKGDCKRLSCLICERQTADCLNGLTLRGRLTIFSYQATI